jgi:hypothetical protein
MITQNDPVRMWVNQPSTQQPMHHMHGTRVLAKPYTDNTSLVWWLEGSVVSSVMPSLYLSAGWPATTQIKPLTDAEKLTLQQKGKRR